MQRAQGKRIAQARPAGSMVLYSQSGDFDTSVPAQTSTAGDESFAADDFVVGDANGWTVSAFDFSVSYTNSLFGSTHFTYNVAVYADNGGVPADGGAALCSATNAEGTLDTTPPFATVSVTMPIPCLLPQGTYWVVLQANTNTNSQAPFTPQMAWRGFPAAPTPGHLPQFENPTNNYNTGCVSWAAATGCGWPDATALGFQVVGMTGGGGGNGLSLALTVAPDNGDPNQCGAATDLSAEVGDKLNFCYTVTNHTGIELDYHTLGDTLGGTLFSLVNQPLADGASYQFNRIVTAESVDNGTVIATWSAQDGRLPGFDYDDSGASRFVDIAASGTLIDDLNSSGDGTREVDMPFSFNFYGTPTNVLGVSSNGGIIVGMVRPLDFNNVALPADGLSYPALLPLWDDFDIGSGGIYYATIGDAPNRTFVVEWANRVHYDGASNTDGATFEVVFDEASGNFSYEYADVEYTANGSSTDPAACNGGVCATVGIQQDTTYYTQYSFDTAALSDGKSIAWSPRVIPAPFSASAQITLDIGAPVVSVAPGALITTAAAGTLTTTMLTVADIGNRSLDWGIDEAAGDGSEAEAHFPRAPYHAPAPSEAARRAIFTSAAATDRGSAASPLAPAQAMPLTSASVPAFAFGGFGPLGGVNPAWLDYFSLDATAPDNLCVLAQMPIEDYVGGAFANNDFSKQYVIGTGGAVYTFDTTTAAMNYIGGATAPGLRFTDLAWDAATQTMYATAWDPVNTSTSHLYTIDLATGASTEVAQVQGVDLASATFDATGHMYGLDILGSELIAIDKRNGTWAGIGPLGFQASYVASIDFDPRTGLIWYAGHPALSSPADQPVPAIYTIDTATGRASEVEPVAQSVDLVAFSLAVAYTGCSAPGDVPWLSIDPDSGSLDSGEGIRLTATLDATSLEAGVYTANLCVLSNDLSRRIVGVPVTFNVTGGSSSGGVIFANGFDGAQ
ncbi:MAG TPA: hypothetical protein VGC55_13325 [Dokdonella sp.]